MPIANPLPYSAAEQRMIDILKKAGRKDTKHLSELFYVKNGPYNSVNSTSALLRTLRRKSLYNKEKWKLHSSRRNGPHPIEWWVA